MPVFLSHKKEDTSQTVSIADYLHRFHGIRCYVDVFDPELKTTNDITSSLMKRVKECSHIMAVVSEYTTKSWWVPFEIGVASELDRRVTTYQLYSTALPDFLTKWPILSSHQDLNTFANHYKNDRSIALEEGRVLAANINSGEAFHSSLKRALGQ